MRQLCDRCFHVIGWWPSNSTAVDRLSFGNKTNITGKNGITLRMIVRRIDDRNHGQVELLGEFKVTIIVRWDRHDRAGSVAGQNVVGDPNGNRACVDRIDGVGAGKDTRFYFVTFGPFAVALERCFFTILFDRCFCSSVVSWSTSGCSGETTM